MPRRSISFMPRVIRPARAFKPSCMPSAMPVATASTFFIAPPSSAPSTSPPEYARRFGACSRLASCCANAASSECTVTALGRPAATSLANDGPVTTAAGRPGSRSATSSCRKRPVPGSKPLVAQAIAVPASSSGASSASIAANA